MKILKFGAPYCVACKRLDEILKDYESEFEITYVDVSTDEGIEIAGEYGICGGIPVIIKINDDGIIEAMMSGLKKKEDYSWIFYK